MSVPEAAERLSVSPARVRQRIDEGSLVAEKIGGRWLVDLMASDQVIVRAGRPVSASAVWWSLAVAESAASPHSPPEGHDLLARLKLAASALDLEAVGASDLSRSSRDRAVRRLAAAIDGHDHDALVAWLNHRASRHLYVAAPADLERLRHEGRLVLAGVSHPDSGLEDLRVIEGYVAAEELDAIVVDHWLEHPRVGERPNVFLHAAPVRPVQIKPALLAADLAEHGGPREIARAHELLERWIGNVNPPPAECRA